MVEEQQVKEVLVWNAVRACLMHIDSWNVTTMWVHVKGWNEMKFEKNIKQNYYTVWTMKVNKRRKWQLRWVDTKTDQPFGLEKVRLDTALAFQQKEGGKNVGFYFQK